jgi:hypothetical protein
MALSHGVAGEAFLAAAASKLRRLAVQRIEARLTSMGAGRADSTSSCWHAFKAWCAACLVEICDYCAQLAMLRWSAGITEIYTASGTSGAHSQVTYLTLSVTLV